MQQSDPDQFKEFQFKRNPFFSVLWALGALIWLVAILLKHVYAIGSMNTFLMALVFILMSINAVWSFTAPYVRIKSGTVTLRTAIFNTRTFQLADVVQLKQDKKKCHLFFSSGKKLVIKGEALDGWQREKLFETLHNIWKSENKQSN